MKLYKLVDGEFVNTCNSDIKEAYHECGYISLDFSIGDLEMKNVDDELGLTPDELLKAKDKIERSDCSIGINWEVIDQALADIVYHKLGV
jgi:hypothetical protein